MQTLLEGLVHDNGAVAAVCALSVRANNRVYEGEKALFYPGQKPLAVPCLKDFRRGEILKLVPEDKLQDVGKAISYDIACLEVVAVAVAYGALADAESAVFLFSPSIKGGTEGRNSRLPKERKYLYENVFDQ